MAGKHQAAILPQKGGPLSVVDRATPEPGPNRRSQGAIAVNPVDYFQREFAMPPPSYPAVVGSDVAGLVVKVGSNVSNAPPSGSRAIALPRLSIKAAPKTMALSRNMSWLSQKASLRSRMPSPSRRVLSSPWPS